MLPVHIVARNESSDTSFIIVKDQISLISEKVYLSQENDTSKVTSSLRKKGEDVSTAVGVILAAGMFILPLAVIALPLSMLGPKMITDAKEIKRNLIEKELQTTTVSKGTSVSGFVYFKLPENNLPVKNFFLRIDVNNLKNRSTNKFEFNISI